MKTNGTRRIVTFMLALVLVFTTVCVGTTEVEAAEKFTTIIAPTQTEQATAGTEVKTREYPKVCVNLQTDVR